MIKKQYLAVLGVSIIFGMGFCNTGSGFDNSCVHAQDRILTETSGATNVIVSEFTVTQGAVSVTSGAVTAVPEVATESAVQPVCQFVLDAQGGIMYGTNKEDKILLYKKDVKGNTIIDVSAIKAQKRNYLFNGWYTKPTGGTKINELKITADTTLYARWTKVTVKKAKISKVQNKTGRKASVKIKKTKGAKGYQVVYSTKRSFKNARKKNTTKRTITLSKLKKKKIYYVKVRGYKKDSTGKKVFGAYSSVKKVRIRR